MTTITVPQSWAQMGDITGVPYIIAAERVRLALADSFDPMALGVAVLVGDLAGSGSDTIRDVYVDDIGFAEKFTAMEGETDPTPDSGFTAAYDSVTVGMYGLAKRETFKNQIFGKPGSGVGLNDLIAKVPASYIATWRELLCTTGAGITTAKGSAGAALDVDAHLALVTHFREQLGGGGRARGLLAPQQITQLVNSYRSEPAFANFSPDFKEMQMLGEGGMYANFAGLNIDFGVTDDVVHSGGAYQGFVSRPGGVGWARASTANIRVKGNLLGYDTQYGIAIYATDEDRGKQARFEALMLLGMALASDDLVTKARFISAI